jgi:tellurite resistance protein TehA-like permease
VAIVLLSAAVIASAFVVYAIYRYGVIPMLRNLRNDTEFNDLWHQGGWQYRVSTITLLLAIPLGVGAGVMLMAGLVWQAGVAFLLAMAILVSANYWRWQFVRRYRAGSPLH